MTARSCGPADSDNEPCCRRAGPGESDIVGALASAGESRLGVDGAPTAAALGTGGSRILAWMDGGPRLAPEGPRGHLDEQEGCRHDKLLLRRAGAGTSLDSILEELPQHVSGEDLSAPSAHWGDKVGCSIYDEEALLGPYVDMGLEEYYAELAEELIGEEGSEGDTDDDYYSDEDEDGSSCIYACASELSRAARAVRPLCRVDEVAKDLPDSCPICLERLIAGQAFWRLPCSHVFHEVCMARHLGTRRAKSCCPVCRCDIRQTAACCAGMITCGVQCAASPSRVRAQIASSIPR